MGPKKAVRVQWSMRSDEARKSGIGVGEFDQLMKVAEAAVEKRRS